MRKKLFSALILSAMFLSSCSPKTESKAEYPRIVSPYTNICQNGELYTNGERLLFCDFETMRTAFICPNPNCTHTDESECSAFGMDNHPILYNNNLYYLKAEIYKDRDLGYRYLTYIYKADTDGTNRKELYKIDGLRVTSGDRMIVDGAFVYFTAEDVAFDEYGTSTNFTKGYLCRYDLENNKFEKLNEIYSGYSSGNWIFGIWNGNIYYYTMTSENYIDWNKIDITQGFDADNYYITKYYCYNIAENTVYKNALPDMIYVGEGYYVYKTGTGICIKPENGSDILIENFNIPSNNIKILNNYLISSDGGICADLNSGKVYRINSEYSDNTQFYDCVYYIDGKYILKKPLAYREDPTDIYIAVYEADYIGEEIV